MDISRQYILMCEKAIEIQSIRKYEDGSLEAESNTKKPYVGFICTHCDDEHGVDSAYLDGNIWLPRQDQLQDMVYKNQTIEELIADFNRWFGIFIDSIPLWFDNYTTLEQLWLAYVMQKKFSKQWDGKDWI